MKKLQRIIVIAAVTLPVFGCLCSADTFTNSRTGEVLHGYATGQAKDGNTPIHTREKGQTELKPADWNIVADRQGRNNKVVVLTLDDEIMLEIQTGAMEKAIAEASYDGPLFILLEIDTPGGRIDFAKRICSAIAKTKGCSIIAFVKGGKYGGALSAGAAVALACNKIYMAQNTTIGAATAIGLSRSGRPEDINKTYGETVGEKISSAWRAYLASLAEQGGRPGLLARAMVDKEIEVVEISDTDKRLFVEPMNKKPDQQIVHTWNKKGSLLTLTADEAAKCMIADKVANSREDVLRDLKAADAEIAMNDDFQKAGKEFERAYLKFNVLKKSIDLEVKQLEQEQTMARGLKLLRDIRGDFKSAIEMAKRYPDLNINVQMLEEELNSVEAIYQKAKIDSKPKRR